MVLSPLNLCADYIREFEIATDNCPRPSIKYGGIGANVLFRVRNSDDALSPDALWHAACTLLCKEEQAMTIYDAGESILDLSTVQLINLGRGMGHHAIHCVSGKVWVTQAGDSRDHILSAGQTLEVESPDVVVIQAFSPAVVRVGPRADRSATAA
jgi:hypothetical protein